jgi:hypothetical protein
MAAVAGRRRAAAEDDDGDDGMTLGDEEDEEDVEVEDLEEGEVVGGGGVRRPHHTTQQPTTNKKQKKQAGGGDKAAALATVGAGYGELMEGGEGALNFRQVPDWAAPGVPWETYVEQRTAFEKRAFFYMPTGMVGVQSDYDGSIKFLNTSEARAYFDPMFSFSVKSGALISSGKYKGTQSFMELWNNDWQRRRVAKVGVVPTAPLGVPQHLYLHLPFKLAAHLYPSIDKLREDRVAEVVAAGGVPGDVPTDAELLWMFRELAANFTGFSLDPVLLAETETAAANEPVFTYLERYIAHMLQKPLERAEVAIAVSGVKGAGKDTMADFLAEFLVGDGYSHNFDDTAAFFEKHMVAADMRLLVKLEDANAKVLSTNSATLRTRITARNIDYNPKGGTIYSSPNLMRLFITCNLATAVSLNEANMRERRVLVCNAYHRSPFVERDRVWFTRVRTHLYTSLGGAVVSVYYNSLQLPAGWHPRLLPDNPAADAQYEDDVQPDERYVMQVWDGTPVTCVVLYGAYKEWCLANHIPVLGVPGHNSIAFGKTLQQLVISNRLKWKYTHGKVKQYWRL